MGRGHEPEDLYQIGCIGLIKAIKRFNTDFDVKLSTYAVPYILGEIKRYIRDDGPIKVSRSLKELNVKIKEMQKEYLDKKGEEISLEKLARKLKVSKEEIAMALESEKPVDSMESAIYKDNKTGSAVNLIDKISTDINEENITLNKMVLNELINELDQRDKEVILLRYYKEKTQTQVAKILGITQVQVSRIEKRILNSMKLKLVM